MITDDKQSIKVKLWNWQDTSKIAVDHDAFVTNLYVDNYDEQPTLTSTDQTEIQVQYFKCV